MQYVIQNKESNRGKQNKLKKKRFLDKFNKINKPKETLIKITQIANTKKITTDLADSERIIIY